MGTGSRAAQGPQGRCPRALVAHASVVGNRLKLQPTGCASLSGRHFQIPNVFIGGLWDFFRGCGDLDRHCWRVPLHHSGSGKLPVKSCKLMVLGLRPFRFNFAVLWPLSGCHVFWAPSQTGCLLIAKSYCLHGHRIEWCYDATLTCRQTDKRVVKLLQLSHSVRWLLPPTLFSFVWYFFF